MDMSQLRSTLVVAGLALFLGAVALLTPRVSAQPSSTPGPFQQTVALTWPAHTPSASVTFAIPGGGTFAVIEEVSVSTTNSGYTMFGSVQTALNGAIANHFISPFPQAVAGNGRPLTIVESRRFYADPGSTATFSYATPPTFGNPGENLQFSLTLSGVSAYVVHPAGGSQIIPAPSSFEIGPTRPR
jgi:hypothetical protein